MLVPALQAFLATFLALGINWYVGQCMSERPIVAGLIAGIIFGDIPTGVMIGCALEAIFMGAVNVGGAVSAEPVTATVVNRGVRSCYGHEPRRSDYRRWHSTRPCCRHYLLDAL